jgi:hypothetical protein
VVECRPDLARKAYVLLSDCLPAISVRAEIPYWPSNGQSQGVRTQRVRAGGRLTLFDQAHQAAEPAASDAPEWRR